MSSVLSFGYVIVETMDVEAWRLFGEGVMGMQAAEQHSERLLLRMDNKVFRYDIRRGESEGVRAVGLEVRNEEALLELCAKLDAAGYTTVREPSELIQERRVRGLASFRDPDDQMTIELYYGLLEAHEPFVSKVDYNFVAGELGIGHVLQVVSDADTYKTLYMDILGYRLSDEIETTPGSYATFLHCNGRHHSFAFSESDGSRPLGVGHLMVEVTELDMVGRTYDKGFSGMARVIGTLGRHTNDKMLSMYIQSPSGFGIEYGVGGIIVDDATWVPRVYSEAHYWGHDKEMVNAG